MKKYMTVLGSVVAVSLATSVFATNVQVILNNSSGVKGYLLSDIGQCPQNTGGGTGNYWLSPVIRNGTESGVLRCPVQITDQYGNSGTYIFIKKNDQETRCAIYADNDVFAVLNNAYTKVYVNVTPGKPCKISRTFAL